MNEKKNDLKNTKKEKTFVKKNETKKAVHIETPEKENKPGNI